MQSNTFLKQRKKSNDDPRVIANLIRATEEVGLEDIQDKIIDELTIEKREIPEIKAAIGFIMLKEGNMNLLKKYLDHYVKAIIVLKLVKSNCMHERFKEIKRCATNNKAGSYFTS